MWVFFELKVIEFFLKNIFKEYIYINLILNFICYLFIFVLKIDVWWNSIDLFCIDSIVDIFYIDIKFR